MKLRFRVLFGQNTATQDWKEPTTLIDGRGRGLSIETSFVTNTKNSHCNWRTGVAIGGYSMVRWLMTSREEPLKGMIYPFLAVGNTRG